MLINMKRDPTAMINIALEAHIKDNARTRIEIIAIRTLTLISIFENHLALKSKKKFSALFNPSTYGITYIAARSVARSHTDKKLV